MLQIIIDYVFIEGPTAFFRAGLVILRLLKNEITNVRDVSEFSQAFDNKVKAVVDIEKFRDRMRSIYINNNLLEICRVKNIELKQNKFDESSNQRVKGYDKCLESSVYCNWERTAKFKEYNDHTIRVYSLSENLKFNYFDPFKNASNVKSYDYLKSGEDKGFMNEDRFSTYVNKKDSKLQGIRGSKGIGIGNAKEVDLDDESILHQTYLEKMISGNIRDRVSIDDDPEFRTGTATKMPNQEDIGKIVTAKGQQMSAIPKATFRSEKEALPTQSQEVSSVVPTQRKNSGNSEINMLRKLGSRLIDLPKQYFENQTPMHPDRTRITLAKLKKIERSLVVARCAHICAYEKYEYMHREINQKVRDKYFLIVNSILYRYLGEGLKRLHEQTLKVISDGPKLTETTIEGMKISHRTQRKFPRMSLDKIPKTLTRFNSLETGRKLVHTRLIGSKYLPDFKDFQQYINPLSEVNIQRPKRMSAINHTENHVQEIPLEEFRTKYKHAYNLDKEALKQDLLRISKKSDLSEEHPIRIETKSL